MPAAILARTRSVLTAVNPDQTGDDARCYERVRDDDDVIERRVYLDVATWQDLGEPDQITITIEPGDRLND